MFLDLTVGVGGVAQTVAQEVERQYGKDPGKAANNSQGEMATAWMFCASLSSTPQLMAGGRDPRPRKLNAVSAMIMAGRASVVAAIIWLVMEGAIWRKMMRKRLAPASSAATTKSS